ncbi:hypothetical protein [Actinomadura sp. CNU-125]|uniref:hypothetical protein n=1 Tax=Actinomadura sp. CNU-125 TaxID=1904961 RepID=UPI0011782BBA|nr:hypothetical protein [Actinomadura sp. CNU-125]
MTTPRTVLAVAAAAVLLAGCGSGETPNASGAESPGTPTSPAPSPAPTRSPSPPPKPLPNADDGTDLDACADGECEVRVSTGDRIPVDNGSGVEQAEVAVAADSVTFEVTLSGGSITTHASPGYPSMAANGLVFEVRGIKGDEAVVVLTGA